jgi:(p)ppGpp synthase/HD superfamily hydrolase
MNTNLWPYFDLSRNLVKKARKGFGNMFRHQVETFAILIEFGYDDPVMLKASLIHDLFEDGLKVGFTKFESVITTDEDGKEVYDLVQELSIKVKDDIEEPKEQYLERIMLKGSQRAKILKLADRLSNIDSLLATSDLSFIKRYLEETRIHILPYADEIDKNIAAELKKSLMKFEAYKK